MLHVDTFIWHLNIDKLSVDITKLHIDTNKLRADTNKIHIDSFILSTLISCI